jgi:hypothetical protein
VLLLLALTTLELMMSKVLCIEACSVLRCALAPSDNSLKILPTDSNQFQLPLNSHVYMIIEADGVREEVRFNGGGTVGGVLTIERSQNPKAFPVGASVCVAITCGFLDDFVCQRASECAIEVVTTTGDIRNTVNTWTKSNLFNGSVAFGGAQWSSALVTSDRLLKVNSGLWVDLRTALAQEQYGYLATVVRTAGSNATIGSRVSARAEAGVTGRVTGSISQAWTSPGSSAPLYGATATVYSQESNSTAEKVGHRVSFKNRADGATATVSGLGANKYNQASVGYLLDAQQRSSAGEFSGWARGIVFEADSLDEAAGVKAVGIDFADLLTASAGRVNALIRLKYDHAIEWNGDSSTYDSVKSAYNRAAGAWGFTFNGNSRFGFKADNGMLSFGDTGATTPLLTATAGATSGKFMPLEVAGVMYKVELRLP